MFHSLHSRLLILAGVALSIFMTAAALMLDQGFRQTARAEIEAKLQGQILLLLGSADLDRPDQPLRGDQLKEPALSIPESGQYAQIFDVNGEVIWRSSSMLGTTIEWPGKRASGDFVFEKTRSSIGESLYCLSYLVQWETHRSRALDVYTLQTCEARHDYHKQIHQFHRSMWLWFGILAVFLLTIQTLTLRWGLGPFHRIAEELLAIESGDQQFLQGKYPLEIQALAGNLNALLAARDAHLQRYRNALGDLAHSLKTPVAVIRLTLESDPRAREIAPILKEPLEQLASTIRYQLQRASTVGQGALVSPLVVAPVLEKILSSLRKVYHARPVTIHGHAEAAALFYGAQGDLMEMLGNLTDNACKWARSAVSVEVLSVQTSGASRRPGLLIRVRDDGPGLPPGKVLEVMQRGARLDRSIEGHGIGLATVKEIVEEVYRGELKLSSDERGTLAEVLLKFS